MKHYSLSFSMKWFIWFLTLVCGISAFNIHSAAAADSLTLYSPYAKISLAPGESVDYTIDVINNSKEIKSVEVNVTGIPSSWTFDLKSGGWNIKQLSIMPGEKKSISLKVEVPMQVNKGNYGFKVNAGSFKLPLWVNVSKQGTFKTEFTTQQANMEGHTKSTFTFNANLKNRTADKQSYALIATTLPGWEITFKAMNKAVTSVDLESNNSSALTIEVKPPDNIGTGKYEIPVQATTSSTSAELDLQVVISGSFNLELTTPSGLLSTNITAGETKRVDLLIKNTGSTILTNLSPTSSAPANWEVTFDPIKIDNIRAGESVPVTALIKADKRAIPGDYMTNIEIRTPEANAKTAIRVSVQTSLLWGWVGILIILLALGSVYYLFRKYGRR